MVSFKRTIYFMEQTKKFIFPANFQIFIASIVPKNSTLEIKSSFSMSKHRQGIRSYRQQVNFLKIIFV